MLFFGWIVLVGLTGFAVINAVGIARRVATGRAELAVVALTSLLALLGGPVLLLGYTNHLRAPTLALTSLVVSSVTFYLLARGSTPREHLRACVGGAWQILIMPFDGVREAIRARSVVVTVGLLWTGGLVAMAFLLTWLVPFTSWDGFYYHEPIIGHAIQMHGFGVVDLPQKQAIQSVNGYPRICEGLSLWFVVFTDKTLVELPNNLGGVGLILSAYAIARRYADRVTAMGWACVLFLVPAAWSQLCASYLDVLVGFFLVAATYHATRPQYRIRDALCATLAMALALESKTPALAWVPPIALVAYGRLLYWHVRARRAATIATVLGGGTFLAALALHYLVRNLLAFQNPFWPITMDVSALDLHWKGLATLRYMAPEPPLKDIAASVYGVPGAGVGDIIHHGYGYAVAWVILPAALLAGPAIAVTALAELFRLKRPGTATNLVWVLVPTIVGLRATPSLDITRYNLHLVAALMFAATWLVSGKAWVRAREGLVASAIVLSIIPFFWLNGWVWYWGASEDLESRLTRPFSAPHAYVDKPFFDLIGKQRFEEIHSGDRVAYDDEFWFPGALWNFDFSNDVAYIPFNSRDAYLARIEHYDPKWVAVGPGSSARKALEDTGRWEVVGRITGADECVALRRKRGPVN